MFKAGDKITPVGECCTRHWKLMEVIKYNSVTKDAIVKDLDGDIIENFNLNPDIGVAFKVVEK
ncbi:hypothetical protein PHYNN_143 [Pantoea phage Phynn]|nr:hypothetical protein PHYNN_143 [Pantoea phage Phynn]